MYLGGQEQFYLEGQIAYAVPKDDDGMHVYCSTQHPSEMQHLVAHVLGVASHDVLVECRRMGGGFGGKESQSGLFACCAALAAWKLLCPVKLRPDRDDDMMITGKRTTFITLRRRLRRRRPHRRRRARHDVALRLLGRPVGPGDDARGLPLRQRLLAADVAIAGYCGKTNTQSNTAFRGFGGPQGAFAIEYILDDIARALGRDPLDVRRANLYGKTERNVTPYGQTVEDNVSTNCSASSRRRAATARAARPSRNSTRAARC
jgi:xanthine dehydrogenase large subunit